MMSEISKDDEKAVAQTVGNTPSDVCILEWDVLCWYRVMWFRRAVTHGLSNLVANH